MRWWKGSGSLIIPPSWCAGGLSSSSLIIHPSFMVRWWMGSDSLIIHPSLVRWWMGCSSLIIHSSFMVRGWVGWLVLVHLTSMIHPSGPWLRVVGGVGNGPTARSLRLVAACFRGVCFAASVKEREEREREREDCGMVRCASLSFFFALGGRRFLTSSNSSSFFIPSSRVCICGTYCYYLLFLGCLSGTFNFTCAEFRRRRTREGGGEDVAMILGFLLR